MLPDEMRKIDEVCLFLQNLASKFCLGHLAIEVCRDGPIEGAVFYVNITWQ